MSRFPFINNVDKRVINAITNTDKTKFSGTQAFAFLECFIQSKAANFIIGNETYQKFNFNDINKQTRRIPPLIKNIDIKTTGNMGAIKKAEVTVQFSSMEDVVANKGFMLIGKTQLLVWGWAKGRDGRQINVEGGTAIAVTAMNALEHYNRVVGQDYDILAGILTNFDLSVNENLTVDVKLELSQPSDIPAFLALNKKNEAVVDGTDGEKAKGSVMAAQAAKLDPTMGKDDAAYKSLLQYTLNIDDELVDFTYGNTQIPYIQFGYIVKTICNKSKDTTMNGMPVDVQIDNAVACARPVMISASEHVIIPAHQLPRTIDTESVTFGKDTVRKITLDVNNTVQFGPINLAEPMEFPASENFTPYKGVTLLAYEYGFIRNLFISADFVKEAARGADNNKEFLEKIINEINVAGAGLWNLALRDIEGGDNSGHKGHMVYTIVDYNLTNDAEPPPMLNLYSSNSTITNISINADMPKEIAGQAMLGGDIQGSDNPVGQIIFKSSAADPVLGAAKQKTTEYKSGGSADSNTGAATTVKDTRGYVKKGLDATTNFISKSADVVSNSVGYVKDAIVSGYHGLTNSPGDLRVKLNPKPYYSGTEGSFFVVVKDPGIIKNMYFGTNGRREKTALLPTKISFTTLGVGGFAIGRILQLPHIPWIDENKGYWQITDVSQTIDSSKWETTVELRFRVKTT